MRDGMILFIFLHKLNSRPNAIRRSEGKTAETAYDVYRAKGTLKTRTSQSPAAKTNNFHKTVPVVSAFVHGVSG